MAGAIVPAELTDGLSGTSTTVAAAQTESRTRLLTPSVARVENLRRNGGRHDKTGEDFCTDYQVCFPYQGIFIWHVEGDDVVGDPNQVIFVRAGERYRVSGPSPGGYAELIITPDIEILSDIAHVNGSGLFEHPLFRRRHWRASPSLQILRSRFFHWANHSNGTDGLEADESVIALLRAAVQDRRPDGGLCGAATARLIRRTKEYLQAGFSQHIRLADIGRAVGASPAYLTDVFSKVEGVALHQYLRQLRLSYALVELPHADDLTTLALEAGFSSHSHFSASFRHAFGCTPSQYRQTARRMPANSSRTVAEAAPEQ
jgi:AraC-like DNA-binding protein